MKRLFAALAVWMLAAIPASAEYVQTSKVRYSVNHVQSQWYTVEVTFLTGMELNRATRTFGYDGFSKYAVIFWGEGQASVIKIGSMMFCSGDFSRSCLPSFGNIEGEDQQGDAWEICTQQFCY